MPREDDGQAAMDRRNFLRAVGGVSTAAVAAAASPIAATEAEAYDPGPGRDQGALPGESRPRQGVLPDERLRDAEEVRAPC